MPIARKVPCVYIITNEPYGTLYIGVTSDLPQRIWQHKEGVIEGFAKRHGLKRLVWYKVFDTMDEAILREKQMKKWERKWKTDLIRELNPRWRDLYEELP